MTRVSLITACLCVLILPGQTAVADAVTSQVKKIVAEAILTEDAEAQVKLVRSLAASGGADAVKLLTRWKEGEIFIFMGDDSKKIPVTLGSEKDGDGKQQAFLLTDGSPLMIAGKPAWVMPSDLDTADTDSNLRVAIKEVTDSAALSASDPAVRMEAIRGIGMSQEIEKLPALQARLAVEKDAKVLRVLEEAVDLTSLRAEKITDRIAACERLGNIGSIPSQDALKAVEREAVERNQTDLANAARTALKRIANHVTAVNTFGTFFRGLSLGSILLVVAIGLAVTFGLMGVINMAHGELLVVGAYTTYVVQGLFATGVVLQIPTFISSSITLRIPGMHLTGGALDSYFLIALPLSFIVAAFVGIALERCVIRFLYKRPLESLLATWGVSLVLQQLFRLIFGANNVQVDSPSWLSGNWTVNDIIFGWNRVFVIGFAIVIIVTTWAVLNRTPLGLLIRSVMQNREMAACMGVRTERVNMLTFGFGSGLAGLAGAFLSQIGNVGPSLGQSYIVDSFMTVVVGGVGNLVGTVISALGIGVTDQSLQQILLNPVLGKILVLAAIILFLQWRPQGLFVTKSRSLES